MAVRQRGTLPAVAAAGFFDRSLTVFRRAARHNVVHDWTGIVAGHRVRLRIAGDGLFPWVTRALAHLAHPIAGRATLTVHAWDSASTGTSMASPPWPREAFGPHGLISGFNDERFLTAFDLGSHSLSLLDEASGHAVFWTRDAAALPPWEAAAPLRRIFHRWLRSRGLQLAHAAAVGLPSGGGLFVGRGGSGKSTTALHLLREGFGYVGDDYVVLAGPPSLAVHSLYRTAKLHLETCRRFPHLLPASDIPASPALPKTVAFIEAGRDGELLRETPMRVVFLPTITRLKASGIEPASVAEAVTAIAPSTILQLPGAGQVDLAHLAVFMRRTRVYRLHLGTDLSAVAPLIRSTLEAADA